MKLIRPVLQWKEPRITHKWYREVVLDLPAWRYFAAYSIYFTSGFIPVFIFTLFFKKEPFPLEKSLLSGFVIGILTCFINWVITLEGKEIRLTKDGVYVKNAEPIKYSQIESFEINVGNYQQHNFKLLIFSLNNKEKFFVGLDDKVDESKLKEILYKYLKT